MFWRNNYEDTTEYVTHLTREPRTNYTYADTKLYRSQTLNSNSVPPHIIRKPLENNQMTGLEDNHMPSRDSTPQRTSLRSLSGTDRVLRSRVSPGRMMMQAASTDQHNVTPTGKHSSSKQWRRHDLCMLNTNSNNPDDSMGPSSHIWPGRLSEGEEDEDVDESTLESTSRFGTNNANTKTTTDKKDSKHWFQKNMFGLPTEESDSETDFTGTVSGDDHFDIEPVNQFNSNQRSSTTNTTASSMKQRSRKAFVHRNTHSDGSHQHQTGFRSANFISIACSPPAMIAYVCSLIYSFLLYVKYFVTRTSRRIQNYCNVSKWYYLPLALPIVISRKTMNFSVYTFDRIFRTNNLRRLLSMSGRHSRTWWLGPLLNLAWLLCWVALTFMVLVYLAPRSPSVDNSPVQHSSLRPLAWLSESWTRLAENHFLADEQCMMADYSQRTVHPGSLSYLRRWLFCMFSLPARWIVNQTDFLMPSSTYTHETDTIDESSNPLDIQSQSISYNLTDQKSMLHQIQQKIKYQDSVVSSLRAKLVKLDQSSTNNAATLESTSNQISKLINEMTAANSDMSIVRHEIGKLSQLREDMDKTVREMSLQKSDNKQSLTATVDNITRTMERDVNHIMSLIQKTENDSENRSQALTKLSKVYNNLKSDFLILNQELSQLKLTTKVLDQHKDQVTKDSQKLKEELLTEMNTRLLGLRKQQSALETRVSAEMTRLETALHRDEMVTTAPDMTAYYDRSQVEALIQTRLNAIRGQLGEEANNSLWEGMADRVKQTVEHSLAGHISGCKCPVSACRCSAPRLLPSLNRAALTSPGCVRLHQVRQLVTEALHLFAADKIGLADFALESAGGTVASTRCTETYTGRAATLTVLGVPLLRLTNSPRIIIQPSLNPGECWAIKGSRGTVVIQLSGQVEVNAVSIDHIPKSLSPSGTIDSAIRDFHVKALENEADENGTLMGSFTYQSDSQPIQTFLIAEPKKTNFVEFTINSNYGNAEYTCIYRVRVHGKLIDY